MSARITPGRKESQKLFGQHGWSVWWDRMLLAGDRFDKAIQQALHAAKCVIVLWSKTSISSDWVKDEAFEGAKRGILVPVLIDDVEIPFGLRQIHAARLTNWEAPSLAPEFREVLDSVSQMLGRPGAPETTPAGADLAAEVLERKATATPVRSSAVEVSSEQKPKLQRRVFPVSRVFTWVAITVIACSLLGGLEYFRRRGTPQSHAGDKTPQAQQESSKTNSDAALPNPQCSLGKQTVSGTVAESENTAGDKATDGIAIGTLEFNWAGEDSWDVYQAEQLVASHWGSAKQALQAGTYTIKPQRLDSGA
jgi:TIR domain-containing protein